MAEKKIHDSAEMLRRLQAGDQEAEREFVEQYGRGVMLVLSRQTNRNPDLVHDLYQETFRITIEKIQSNQIKDPGKLAAFMLSTARFVAIEHYRREARYQQQENMDQVVSYGVPSADQYQALRDKERSNLVRRVMAELKSERDREILFRFYISEEEKDDICKDLQLSSLHFNRVLHRARQRYQALFEEALAVQQS